MTPRVGVFGAGGSMGREVIRAVLESDAAELGGAFEHEESEHLGADAGALAGVGKCGISLAAAGDLAGADVGADVGVGAGVGAGVGVGVGVGVVIDFSTPSGSVRCARLCAEGGIALVTGVTGLTAEEQAKVELAGEKIPVVLAANMSVGVNAMADVIGRLAVLLRAGKLGGGFDMEVFEAHHRRKKDAPSGTALFLGEVLAEATKSDLGECGVYGRHGREEKRGAGDIGFSVMRGGDIAGEHRVVFAGDGEVLEVVHRAGNRGAFARGAVRAALFAAAAKKGVYGMREVLGG